MRRSAKDTDSSAKGITRRGLVLGGIQLAFAGVLAARMRYLGIEQASEFRLLAEENRINIHLLPPARGLIFDREGRPIAGNEPNYRVVIRREDARDLDQVMNRLQPLIGLDEDNMERIRRELRRAGPSVPVTIADRLSWEDLSKVAVNTPSLPGVTPDVGLSRHYPLDKDFAHVVGYVGPVSDYDLSRIEDQDPLLQIPKFQIGKSGAEAKLEAQLRGSAGTTRVEVNAGGRIMRELSREEGRPGDNIQLTVDAALQNYVQARLEGGLSAAAVVMDTETGDILAAGSAPTFDPNKFVRGISVADYAALTENPYRPLAGKAVQGLYPPGSTFKMVTALAALEEGIITPDDTVRCLGHVEVSGRRFHCWKRAGHGTMDLYGSLQQSCDVYYYDIAQRVGIEKISEMARRLGFGYKFDLPMSAVAEGLAPTKEWKLARRGEDWLIGDTLNASIGQGFVLASPLQLSVMTARLATGREIIPRLVKSINGVEQNIRGGESLNINENNLRQIRRAMYGVSNTRRGTAYRSRIVEDEYRMSGKTGTSQVSNRVVRNSEVPWVQRDHALFVGFAPFDDPKISVSVVVEHGGGGSAAAAPVARDIILQALYGGEPPLSAYPSSEQPRIEQIRRGLQVRDPEDFELGRTRA
ncbi:penicillin-binding protein 2 [Cochlodiniinecator piscidefendens]|uniref:penicillin-binding protein 2 n=1 Tax=Cochlodiniinecator piscidefendens TaxID=2715756 RepID=UPI00140A51D5|nr:penicillin-binding protein 2 [Cochlodiniinecator piscidefendens]